MQGHWTYSLAAGATAALVAASQGAIRASSPDSFVQLAQVNGPSVVTSGAPAFSCFVWIHRSDADSQPMYILEIPGAFDLLVDPADQSIRSHRGGTGGPGGAGVALELILPLRDRTGEVPLDEWILLGISWNNSTGEFRGWARSENLPRVQDSIVAPGFAPSGPLGDLTLGWPQRAGTVAQQGVYGLIVFRDLAVDGGDFDDVWAQRDYFGGYRIDNVLGGGNLNGPNGAVWMVNHAILTNPSEAVTGIPASAALPGDTIAIDNYCVLDTSDPDSTLLTAGLVSSLSPAPDSFEYVSPYDVGGEPFFIRQVPAVPDLPEPWYVTGVAPKIRQLALGTPQGLIRCVVSANSRGTKTSDADDQTWPENYAHGFIQTHLGVVAGVLNRPARINAGHRWFAFDNLNAPVRSGVVSHITAAGAQQGFARLWSNSASAPVGPGQGIWMNDGAVFALKAKPEPGSLVVADAPLVVRTYMLRFPGAGTLSWRPVKAAAQNLPGTTGPATTVDLGAPGSFSHVLAGADVVDPVLSQLVLDGDFTTQVNAGDAVFVSAGLGEGNFSVISGVSGDGVTTWITLEHWFTHSPVTGSTIEIGPWEIVTVEHEWPALAPSETEVWRGLELTAVGGPVVNFAWDAWRPDVSGLVFGIAGWGGHGYTGQLEEAFATATPAWMQALGPDVWLQGFATQASEPVSMSDYLNEIRQALPEVEVAWLGEGEHSIFGEGSQAWHVYILNEAQAAGVTAATMVRDLSIGTFPDQCADGQRADSAHLTHRGNTRLAEGWTAMLRQAAMASPDIDGDGVVGITDFLLLLENWGPCPAPPTFCAADLDGDGVVGITDFLLLLGNWG